MTRRMWLSAAVVAAAPLAKARAEKVNMSPEQLLKTATHVVTGPVLAIYERTRDEGDFRVTRYVAEVRVETCEKGDGPKKGDLVYVRYWRRRWIARRPMPPDTLGHRGLPAEGDTIRVYLARNAYDGFNPNNNDGGFNAIGANGFETLKPASAK
jgi:hypothetical protein